LDGRDTGQDTVFQNLSSGPHTITLEDQNQCFLSFEVILESEVPEIEIPNGFTPNGDGMNDIWELSDLSELYPNMQIQVFNRWGQMVFSSKGYSNPWNGKRHGQDLPTATYYYIIALSNDIDPLQGNVTIIR
jgi:gliding motility-associated-like protein